jgi:hypothetical protein
LYIDIKHNNNNNNNITICTAYEQQVTGMIAPNAFLFHIYGNITFYLRHLIYALFRTTITKA